MRGVTNPVEAQALGSERYDVATIRQIVTSENVADTLTTDDSKHLLGCLVRC